MYDDTPNTHDLFAKLRAEWLGKDGIRTNRALSERLTAALGRSVPLQRLGPYASGSDPRPVPWDVLLWLCEELRCEVRIDARGARVSERSWP